MSERCDTDRLTGRRRTSALAGGRRIRHRPGVDRVTQLQLAGLELIGLAILGVALLGHGITQIMRGQTPIGRANLRARLARIGVSSKGGELRGAVDGVEIEVEELSSTDTPYVVSAASPRPFDGLTITAVADGPGAERVLTGDEDFDGLVQVEGPRALAPLILALLGAEERALLMSAVSAGWSFAQSRWSQVVLRPREVTRAATDGARLANALASAGARAERPLERVAELFMSDRVAGVRAKRLELLLESDAEAATALARSVLLSSDPQQEVRLVAARFLADYTTLADLVTTAHPEALRREAFQAMVRAADPEGWAVAVAALDRVAHVPTAQASALSEVGELVSAHTFPGRLELARRWAAGPHTELHPHAWRVLGQDGDQHDLERLAGMRAHPELERARAQIRARLVARGLDGGQLALSSASDSSGGELSVIAPEQSSEEEFAT